MVTVIYSELPSKRVQLATQVDAQESATLEYLAEGNANIVYSFKPIANNAIPSVVRHKLLRLRKDKSFIQSTKSQAATFQQEFVPLFRPENLIEQTLITVDEALVGRLNQELEEHETDELRHALRHSDRLAIDGHGLLMTDMTARHGEFLFEIKPKWLLQSPDAPDDAKRCRTCALRLQRAHATADGTVMPKPGGFCPLSLVDDDVEERQKAFESIIDAQYKTTVIHVFSIGCNILTFIDPIAVRTVVSFLAEKGYHVLETLRKHQARFDKYGLLNSCSDGVSDDYSKAMTLRDCVLFVKGSKDALEDTADIRLADLDFKHAHPDKVAKWMSTERTLIDQGWYTNTEINGRIDSTCLLTRRSLPTT